MKTLLGVIFLLVCTTAMAQTEKKSVVIGSMASKPNALLIVNPQHSDQGVVLPQLSSTQRMNMTPSSPAEDGLIVFDLTIGSYFYWTQGAWVRVLNDATTEIKFNSLDAASFSPLKSDDNSHHSNIAIFKSENTFVTATREGSGEIIAPLELPHGAAIRELTIYYLDNADKDIQVRLVRQRFTGESDILLNWQSSNSSATVNAEAFHDFNNMEVVDCENYTYRLIVAFDNDDEVRSAQEAHQRIYGVKIKYEL